MVFTCAGIPMIFQGQEFVEDGWFDEKNPLDWSKFSTFKGIARLYRDCILLRRNIRRFNRRDFLVIIQTRIHVK